MTDRHPGILTVRDTEVLRLLRRLVSIGVYRKTFTADDVTRVAATWLSPRQASIVPLRLLDPVIDPEPADDGVRSVRLTGYQAAVVRELCREGGSNAEIGEALGITEASVKTHLKLAFPAVGVRDRAQLIALVLGGKVRIVTNRKKAS